MTIYELLDQSRTQAIEKRHTDLVALNRGLAGIDTAVILLSKGYALLDDVDEVMGDQTDARKVSPKLPSDESEEEEDNEGSNQLELELPLEGESNS